MSAQVFHPSTNSIVRWTIILGGVLAPVLLLALGVYVRSDFYNRVRDPLPQPIPFSHERHVAGNGIDCRYCHTSVEETAYAGIPPTETCMSCHSMVLEGSPLIQRIQVAWETDQPILWTKVNDLPDYAYINHSIHIAKGIGCTTCHGPVDEMKLTWREHPLHMQWCIDCHRSPEQYIRPKEEVFNVNYDPAVDNEKHGYPADQLEAGIKLVEDYQVNTSQLTDCGVCHH